MNLQNLLYQCNIRYCNKDYDGAIRICEEILFVYPDSAEAYLLRGKSFLAKDYFGPALRDIHFAHNISANVESHYFFAQGRIKEK
jgi:tetratricopeptide (TPR) repeat protein